MKNNRLFDLYWVTGTDRLKIMEAVPFGIARAKELNLKRISPSQWFGGKFCILFNNSNYK